MTDWWDQQDALADAEDARRVEFEATGGCNHRTASHHPAGVLAGERQAALTPDEEQL